MVKTILLSALVGLLLVVGGCAQEPLVDRLPSPNFNGPSGQPNGTKTAVVVLPTHPAPTKPTLPVKPPVAPPIAVPRDWVPTVAANNWQWIVIHHSATPNGGANAFERAHQKKGWDELGYHFVIGNGTDTRDGAVEVGSRWPKQKWGAHTKTPDNRYNNFGIGICLVGELDKRGPSSAQLQSLAKLVAHLQKTYRIPAGQIIGHGDAKSTECPGRFTNVAEIRRQAGQILANSGNAAPASNRPNPGREMITDLPRR